MGQVNRGIKSYLWLLMLISVALLSACGGDDRVALPDEAVSPDDGARAETPEEIQAPNDVQPLAPPDIAVDTSGPAADSGAPAGTVVVTVGDSRYEVEIDLAAGNQCDPDFFGGFLVSAAEFGGTGTAVSGQFLPQEMGGVAALTVADRFNDREWVADSTTMRFGFGYRQGVSQVDSWSQEGSSVSGKATFTDAVAVFAWIGEGSVPGEEPAPVKGSFTINCPSGS